MLAEIGINALSIFPELGLVLFLGVFVAVAVRAVRRPRTEMSRCAHMPLEDAPGRTADVQNEDNHRRGDAR